MLHTAVPSALTKKWAESGVNVNTIPANSLIGTTPGAASLTDGFPPLCFQPLPPLGSGVAPDGADLNGILKWITEIQQFQQAGGLFPYNSAFSTAIGGYPKGAIIRSADGNKIWQSTANNNTTDPDGGSPANWRDLNGGNGFQYFSTSGSFTAPFTGWYTIEVWGGGAGGSGGTTGGAGSAGGYSKGRFLLTGGTSYTVTIGAGGAGANSANSGAGGTTSFSSLISATGGASTPAGSIPGISGVGSGGYLNLTGGAGQDINSGPEDAHGGSAPRGGIGGTSHRAAVAPGAGGGASATAGVGYNGAAGGCAIEW